MSALTWGGILLVLIAFFTFDFLIELLVLFVIDLFVIFFIRHIPADMCQPCLVEAARRDACSAHKRTSAARPAARPAPHRFMWEEPV